MNVGKQLYQVRYVIYPIMNLLKLIKEYYDNVNIRGISVDI